ncbi:unnamed protein product [Caretta caretta]
MAVGAPWQVSVTFGDVSVHFSLGEWEMLAEWQKELHWEVMKENYRSLVLLGYDRATPDTLPQMERGEEPGVGNQQDWVKSRAPTPMSDAQEE